MANVFNAAKAAPVLSAGVLLGLRPYADLEALARANNADAIKLPANYKGQQPTGELPSFVSLQSLPDWASEKASSRYRPRAPRGHGRNAKPKVAVRPGMNDAQRAAFYARNGGAFQKPDGTGVKTGGGTKTNDPAIQRELRASMKGSGGGGKKKG